MAAFNWQCPFCNHYAIITDSNHENIEGRFRNYGNGVRIWSGRHITCPNPNCNEYSFEFSISREIVYRNGMPSFRLEHKWNLVPEFTSMQLPNYIPKAVGVDYKEACLIATKSPKASATLARRCLQGMIRDFWNIEVKSGRLADEINGIRDKVNKTTWDAIDTVRKIGNIGAHMEKDINVIIDVEPEEAKLLLGLIEMLIKDWYIGRHEREEQLQAIIALGAQKQEQKALPDK